MARRLFPPLHYLYTHLLQSLLRIAVGKELNGLLRAVGVFLGEHSGLLQTVAVEY